MLRSSPVEVFSQKDALQTESKPTGEKPSRGVVSTKLLCNFTEITNMQHTHRKPSFRRLLLYIKEFLKDLNYKKLLFSC